MTSNEFLELGLPEPPTNGSAFDKWQAQVDLLLLRRLESVEKISENFRRGMQVAKALVALSVLISSIATTIATVVGFKKG